MKREMSHGNKEKTEKCTKGRGAERVEEKEAHMQAEAATKNDQMAKPTHTNKTNRQVM